ncbi:MAG TPA: hydroxyacylglutathione hydrolase family protein [Solirubrobacteraceae bacterium]|nr:hydroxyacylglutathione hydrolase family protein [Solirubrobacteraceae bacterium]
MDLERSMHEQFLSNTYLVSDGTTAVMIDAGGPVEPLLRTIRDRGLALSHVLLTHHHYDHVCELDQVLAAHPDAAVLGHELEEVEGRTGTLAPGDVVQAGELRLEAIHTPGHTAGMLSFLVDGNVFTGDTLFRNSVGGVRAPGHTTFEDIRASIMDRLLELPPETRIHPGHTDPTTVAQEWEGNAFVRVWRGLDPEGDEPCTALGEPATLVLLGDDYDGGHKAWVRWPDGRDDIVPGSQVQRGS